MTNGAVLLKEASSVKFVVCFTAFRNIDMGPPLSITRTVPYLPLAQLDYGHTIERSKSMIGQRILGFDPTLNVTFAVEIILRRSVVL